MCHDKRMNEYEKELLHEMGGREEGRREEEEARAWHDGGGRKEARE